MLSTSPGDLTFFFSIRTAFSTLSIGASTIWDISRISTLMWGWGRVGGVLPKNRGSGIAAPGARSDAAHSRRRCWGDARGGRPPLAVTVQGYNRLDFFG